MNNKQIEEIMKELEDLATFNYNVYLGGTVSRADDGRDWSYADCLNEVAEYVITALAEREREILTRAKSILEAEKSIYGTDKHGLSYEQLDNLLTPNRE